MVWIEKIVNIILTIFSVLKNVINTKKLNFIINNFMPRFISKCPFCSNNDYINWCHTGCSSAKGEEIDIYGYIKCNDCLKRWHLFDNSFHCTTHDIKKKITKKSQIRTLVCLICKIDNIDDNFLDQLQENLISEWDRIH